MRKTIIKTRNNHYYITMLNPNLQVVNFSQNEYKFYAQHLILPKIELEGQKRLKKAKILCIGVGGLGSACLLYLAASGVGNIGIIDHDTVEQSNLQRQIIYQISNIGNRKVVCAQKNIQKINPNCIVQIYNDFLDLHNALLIIPKYDLVIDGTDNLKTKYIISNACNILNKPHIYGAISGFTGQLSVFNYQGGPNYQDLYPIEHLNNHLTKCTEEGILGTLPGIIGILQATEVIKIITGVGHVLSESILIYNALNSSFKKIRLRKNTVFIHTKKQHNKVFSNTYYNNDTSTRLLSQKTNLTHNTIDHTKINHIIQTYTPQILLIDVRNPSEYRSSKIKYAVNIPLKQLKNKKIISFLTHESKTKQIYIYCSTESRAIAALSLLKKHKINGIHLRAKINEL